ncbi:hypothetical protein MKEN_00718700 [Mycena kentingensis (nom. inval.)]|nr:hypothetical protein MKEN_00718700 [Mycena kentingensis (nom. inval.)]
MSPLQLDSTSSEHVQLELPPQSDANTDSSRRSGPHVFWILGGVIYFIVKIVQLTASLHGWTKTATVLNALVDFLVVPSSHWIAANERRSPGAIGRFFAAAKERFDEYVRGARERLGRRQPLRMVDPEQLESLGRPSTPPTAAHARVSSPSPEPEPIHATAVEIHEETSNLTYRAHHAPQEIPVPLFVRTTIPTSPNSPVSCPRCSRRPFPSYDAWVVHCVAKIRPPLLSAVRAVV